MRKCLQKESGLLWAFFFIFTPLYSEKCIAFLFIHGLQDIDSNELLSAITRLKDLNYKDSEKKMEECFEKYYKEAEEYYDEGNKKEALNHFSVLANYKI